MYIVCIRINTSNMRYYFYFCYCKIRIYICLFFKTPSIFILKWKMSKTWYWFFCSQHIALKVYEPNVLAYREFIIIGWTLLVRYWVHVCVPSSVKLSLVTPPQAYRKCKFSFSLICSSVCHNWRKRLTIFIFF